MIIWIVLFYVCVFFFKQKTAYEMRISDWSSDVCSSDLLVRPEREDAACVAPRRQVSVDRQQFRHAAGDIHRIFHHVGEEVADSGRPYRREEFLHVEFYRAALDTVLGGVGDVGMFLDPRMQVGRGLDLR